MTSVVPFKASEPTHNPVLQRSAMLVAKISKQILLATNLNYKPVRVCSVANANGEISRLECTSVSCVGGVLVRW
jgi:hypothetical protein